MIPRPPAQLCRVEVLSATTGWTAIVRESRAYCMGYFERMKDTPPPRLAARVVRGDKVLAELAADADVSIGAFAGFPSPEMYEAAAERAKARAAYMRARLSP